jgi:2-(1,2-epoxy-1,2-dihydrophenyl)acetyl-CoA isomerase
MWTRIEGRGSVAVLTMVNEAGFNAFDPRIIAHIRAEFQQLLADDAVRSVVLTGTGKVFSTGADVRAMAQAAEEGRATQWVLDATAALHPLMLEMLASDKPIVAAVNGVAAGGGLGLALAADGRIGSPSARFAAGYFGLGLSPDGGSTWLLPRLIGLQRTRRFFFDNEVMDADTALLHGLLDEIHPADELLARAVQVAQRWGNWAKSSRQSTKRLLDASMHSDFLTQLDLERGLIAAAAGTEDFRAGSAAFVAKKKPTFR